jgi:hypothetical protein
MVNSKTIFLGFRVRYFEPNIFSLAKYKVIFKLAGYDLTSNWGSQACSFTNGVELFCHEKARKTIPTILKKLRFAKVCTF